MENLSRQRFGSSEFIAIVFLALVAVYFFHSIPHGLLGLLLGTGFFYLSNRQWNFLKLWIKDLLNVTIERSILLISYLLLWSLLIYTVASHRTWESITSPWELLDIGFWGLLCLQLVFVYFSSSRFSSAQQSVITFLTYLSSFSLLSLLLPIGFGYDRFVHEATIQYIREHGAITPKQPYYIGLYLPIIAITELTKLSVQTVMSWFLPVVSAFMLTYLQPKSVRYPAYSLALFAPFTFTVPYNAVLLFFPYTYQLLQNKRDTLALLVSLIAITIHPLGGTFLLALTFGSILLKRFPTVYTLLICFIGSVLAILGPFYLHQRLGGGTILPFSLEAIKGSVKILYTSVVHWHWGALTPLYAYFYLWPLVIGIIGCLYAYRKQKLLSAFFALQFIALNSCAVFIASHFRFFDIVAGEQYEFAFRLVMLNTWIILPFLIAERFTESLTFFIIPLSMAGVFISYPQFNEYIPYYAPTASQLDRDTVDWIDLQRNQGPYAVLAPQLVSAIALRKHHFAESLTTSEGHIYPYAIPTGDTLYQMYLGLMSGHELDAKISVIQDFTQSAQLFIVVDRSWDPYGVLEQYFSQRAIDSVLFNEGRGIYKLF